MLYGMVHRKLWSQVWGYLVWAFRKLVRFQNGLAMPVVPTCAHGCAVPSRVLNCAQMCSYAVPCPISKRVSLNVIILCSCPLSHLLAKAA